MAKPAEQFLAVDFGVLAELDDNEAALELVQMYEEETKGVLSQLEGHLSVEEGSEAQSWSSIWAFLHKLKGSSLSIGLTGLAEFIESLRNSDTSTLREWYPNTFAELKYAVDHGVKKIMDEIQKQ